MGGRGGSLLDKEYSLKRSSALVFIWFLYPREHSVSSEFFFVCVCGDSLFLPAHAGFTREEETSSKRRKKRKHG